MTRRPFVTVSCAVSSDGFLDTAAPPRLVLSDAVDLDRVDALRAASDAVLVGAGTVRLDDPRLLVRSPARRAERERTGRPASPWKVTVTRSGDLDPSSAFFRAGGAAAADAVGTDAGHARADAGDGAGGGGAGAPRLIYTKAAVARASVGRLDALVIGLPDGFTMSEVMANLARRGVRRLLIEGGGAVLRQVLEEGLVDEMRLATAPNVVVRDPSAPAFPWSAMPSDVVPVDTTVVGSVVVQHYRFAPRVRTDSLPPRLVSVGSRTS